MILLISAVFPPEPVVSATLVYDMAVALSEKRKVKVLTAKPSRPKGFLFKQITKEKRNFEQIVLDSYICPESKLFGRIRESYSFGKHAVKYVKENHEAIQCIYFDSWPLLSQYLIVRVAKFFAIPSIIHVQDIYPEALCNKMPIFGGLINFLLLPLDKYILRNASKIIAISENMRNTLIQTRQVPSEKVKIIQNWQDEKTFIDYIKLHLDRDPDMQDYKPFTFMYLGNIGPVAGVDFLINSFASAKITNAKLVIAGSGAKKNECIKIAKSHQNSNIVFMDVPFGKVPMIQNSADIMLLPIKKGAAMSSIPSKLPAYLFSEKPVIACVDEESDTSSAIREADCGWVISPENPVALCQIMKIVISLPVNELRRLGKNGFNYALENYSKSKNLKKILTLIDDVLTYDS